MFVGFMRRLAGRKPVSPPGRNLSRAPRKPGFFFKAVSPPVKRDAANRASPNPATGPAIPCKTANLEPPVVAIAVDTFFAAPPPE